MKWFISAKHATDRLLIAAMVCMGLLLNGCGGPEGMSAALTSKPRLHAPTIVFENDLEAKRLEAENLLKELEANGFDPKSIEAGEAATADDPYAVFVGMFRAETKRDWEEFVSELDTMIAGLTEADSLRPADVTELKQRLDALAADKNGADQSTLQMLQTAQDLLATYDAQCKLVVTTAKSLVAACQPIRDALLPAIADVEALRTAQLTGDAAKAHVETKLLGADGSAVKLTGAVHASGKNVTEQSIAFRKAVSDSQTTRSQLLVALEAVGAHDKHVKQVAEKYIAEDATGVNLKVPRVLAAAAYVTLATKAILAAFALGIVAGIAVAILAVLLGIFAFASGGGSGGGDSAEGTAQDGGGNGQKPGDKQGKSDTGTDDNGQATDGKQNGELPEGSESVLAHGAKDGTHTFRFYRLKIKGKDETGIRIFVNKDESKPVDLLLPTDDELAAVHAALGAGKLKVESIAVGSAESPLPVRIHVSGLDDGKTKEVLFEDSKDAEHPVSVSIKG